MPVATWFALALALGAMGGCGGVPSRPDPVAAAVDAGFVRAEVPAGPFTLLALTRPATTRPGTLHVYVEGDGAAFRHRHRPAADPTPRVAMGLELARADTSGAAVLYLARPCQYRGTPPPPPCGPALWTSGRYGAPVIDAMAAALARLAPAGTRPVLVGYSGGGTVAVLLAARRGDVGGVVTVAANLDHGLWTRMHGVTPLSESLDPLSQAAALGTVPQVHYVGAGDDNVPESVVRSFVTRLPAGAPATVLVEPAFDHDCCWAAQWPRLLAAALDRLGANPE